MKKTLAMLLTIVMAVGIMTACGENTATPDEASPDTVVTASVDETTVPSSEPTTVSYKDNIEQLISDEGLRVSSDGTVTDADGKKLEVKDGKVTVTAENGEKYEVAVDTIKTVNKGNANSSGNKSSSTSKSGSASTSSSAKSAGNTGGSTNTNTGTNNSNNNTGNNNTNTNNNTQQSEQKPAEKPTQKPTQKPTEKPTEKPTQPKYTFDVDYFYSQTVAYAQSKGMMLDTSLTLDNAAWRNPEILFGKYLTERSTDWWISNSGYGSVDAVINEGLSEGYLPTDTYFNVIIHQLHEGVYYTELGRTATAAEDGGYTVTIPYC